MPWNAAILQLAYEILCHNDVFMMFRIDDLVMTLLGVEMSYKVFAL
jgi:hypothetical protein